MLFSQNMPYLLAAGTADGIVNIYHLDGTEPATLKGRHSRSASEGINRSILGVCFSPDGQHLAVAHADSTIGLWRQEPIRERRRSGLPKLNYTLTHTLKGHQGEVFAVCFSPDRQLIATASADETIRIWQREGSLIKTIKGLTGAVFGLSFSSNSKLIASAGADNTVKLWHPNGVCLRTFQGHESEVYSVNFSPDGKKLVSSSRDGTIKLWLRDSAWGRNGRVLTFTGHQNAVFQVRFSPTGAAIASASADGTVKLWALDGGLIHTLHHENLVYAVSFSPDGAFLATASEDKTVKIWSPQGGKLLKTFCASYPVYCLDFLPHDRTP
ncbi:WD40 repeat domain-containing protein [[Phormidium] sp. ETS-05]|uniref:WD40 repeat domain-containing protein n=1 Tax=[Phormidium] sp. ETS-05 TaxID=222819 RepID=UPI0018EEDD47|nr:WD40 repeat domain-containing protein [[Phormidium] sp. ETS-05]